MSASANSCRQAIVECHEDRRNQRWKVVVKRGTFGQCTLRSGSEEWTASPTSPRVGAQWTDNKRSLLRVVVDWRSSGKTKSRSAHRQADSASDPANTRPATFRSQDMQARTMPLQKSHQQNMQHFARKCPRDAQPKGAENIPILRQHRSPSRPPEQHKTAVLDAVQSANKVKPSQPTWPC